MAGQGMRRGIFITFEGPEGCGKSTQAKLLYEYLKSNRYPCVCTREPGGTRAGEEIREIILNAKGTRIGDLTELFLFEACRAEIVSELINPSLADGKIVICDRFSDATVSYQGYGGGVPLKIIKELNRIATGGIEPALTLLLDIDTLVGLKRARVKGADRIEAKDISYHNRVRRGYLACAKSAPKRIKVIRVDRGINEIQLLVRAEVMRVIRRYKRTG